jgi:DNA-binding beta-propeller fold protein YncE
MTDLSSFDFQRRWYIMKWFSFLLFILGITLSVIPSVVHAEILAMLNYESKPQQTIRREGIAIIDVDPASENFGSILVDIPLPPNLINHHIFYNKNASKAYLTALGQSDLHVMDMTRYPYRITKVGVPECLVGEDIIFSDDNKKWFLTCMGSSKVIVGNAVTDEQLKIISPSKPYPHGIAINEDIDRMIITSSVRPSDLGDPGETVSVFETSTGKELSSHKLSQKPSPSGVAPVEVLFVPGAKPPTAYVTNVFGGTIWVGTWDAIKKDFKFVEAFDFNAIGNSVPLEMYFNEKGDRLYVTTASPGRFHIFDISGSLLKPKLLKTLEVGGGAHHVAFSPDGRLAFVQNNFLGLPGMDDGSVTVLDLVKEKVIRSMDTLKNQGFNPNSIVLLPEWHHDAGH